MPQVPGGANGRDREMIGRILSASRYIILLAVISALISSITTLVFSFVMVLAMVYNMMLAREFTSVMGHNLSVEVIGVIDLILLGAVLYVIALGLYTLFISENVAIPAWLEFRDIRSLEGTLLVVIVIILSVTFLGAVVDWRGSNILEIGAAVALVLIAIAIVLWVAVQSRRYSQ